MRLLMILPLLTLLAVFPQSVLADTSSIQVNISRYLDMNVVNPGMAVTVKLDCRVVGNLTGLIITERLPLEFRLLNWTSKPSPTGIRFNETTNELKWLFFSFQGGSRNITISYTVEAPLEVEEKTYVFEGDWKAVGDGEQSSGLAPVTEILVEKAPSAISCYISTSKIKVGEVFTVSGLISPAHSNVTVTLEYTKPNASTIVRNVTAYQDGSFSDILKADVEGSWSVIASWSGDKDHEGALSSTVFFTVENPAGSMVSIQVIVILSLMAAVVVTVVLVSIRRRS